MGGTVRQNNFLPLEAGEEDDGSARQDESALYTLLQLEEAGRNDEDESGLPSPTGG